jgi:hypothetical protein
MSVRGVRKGGRRLAWLGSLVLLGSLLSAAGPGTSSGVAATGVPVTNSLQQVYHPGAAGTPSTAIPDCIAPDDPVGCYSGDKLQLQGIKVGQKGMEPTIGVTPDGAAVYGGATIVADTAQAWGGAQTDAMLSSDGGLTWSSISLKVPMTGERIPPANADPMIYVDPTTGRIFTFDLTGACNWLNYTDDKGATWIANPVACGDVTVDHQTIIAAKPRAPLVTTLYPNVLYWCTNRLVESVCGRSIDGGITWTTTGLPAYTAMDDCVGLTGHLGADPDGRIFLPSGNCNNPWVSISEDNGQSWTPVQVSTMGVMDSHTSVVSDSAGNLYYAWIGDGQLPYLAISTDHGLHWSDPIMIAPPGVKQINFPVVAAGDPGHIAINFPSTTQTGTKRAWDQTEVITTDALDLGAAIYLSATGNDPADPVHRGTCLGRCGGMWDFIDIQIAKTGELWAAASDDCAGTCNTGTVSAAHAGDGLAIRQIGGPLLRTPPGS